MSASLVAFRSLAMTVPPRYGRSRRPRYGAACLTPVSFAFTASVGALVSVGLGLLDHPEACSPRVHQYDAERVSSLHLADDLARHADATVPHPRSRSR